jgi:fumarate hydratase class II
MWRKKQRVRVFYPFIQIIQTYPKAKLLAKKPAHKTKNEHPIHLANDIRWLASGPRCGLGELTLPA